MSEQTRSEQTSFKALWVEELGCQQFEQSIVERRFSDLPHNDLLVEVHYSSLNFKDAMSTMGNKAITRSYPHTPGIDAAGVVLEDASGKFEAGERVLFFGYDLGMNTPGGLAQAIRVPADWAVSCPSELSLKEAMTYGTGGVTAALCIEKLQMMGARPEDGPVAVTGASGGVGSVSIALLTQLGFSVAAITGKLEESEKLCALGARQVLDRNILSELDERLVGKPQWAHAIDTLGGNYLFNLVKSVAPGGGVASCGLAAGTHFQGNVFPFITRGVSLLGVDSMMLPLAQKRHIWQRIATDMKLPNLEDFSEEIALALVPEYLTRMFNGHSIGRYVVNLQA